MRPRVVATLVLALSTSPAAAAPPRGEGDRVERRATKTRTLSAPERLAGVRWPAGATIEQAMDGTLLNAYVLLDAPWNTGSHVWPSGTTLMFDTGHNALWASRQLSAPDRIGGVDWPAGTVLSFDADGAIGSAGIVVASPMTWAGVRWEVGTRLDIDPHGKVFGAGRSLGAAAKVEGVAWPAGAFLVLDPATGGVTSASLQLTAGGTIDVGPVAGVRWPPMTSLGFDAHGHVTHASCWVVDALTWQGTTYAPSSQLTLDPRTGAVTAVESRIEE